MFNNFEGITYVPASVGGEAGDHIAANLISKVDFHTVIALFDMGGTMTKATDFPAPVLEDGSDSPLYSYIVGLEWSNGHFLVVPLLDAGNTVWSVELDGSYSGPLATFDGQKDVESLTALPDGRFVYLDYDVGTLHFIGPGFEPLPGDRPWPLGTPGFGRPTNVFWNPDTGEFWSRTSSQLKALAADLSPSRTVSTLSEGNPALGLSASGGMSYDAETHRLAVANRAGNRRRGLYLFDQQGQFDSRLAFQFIVYPTPLAPPNPFEERPATVGALGGGLYAYIAVPAPPRPGHEFDFPPPVQPNTLVRIVRSTGVPPKLSPNLTPLPVYQAELVSSFTLSDNKRGPLQKLPDGRLVIGDSIYDSVGNRKATLDPRSLRMGTVTSLSWISSGPWAGKWVMTDPNASAVIVFDWRP
jgi:hypothetical protein